MQFSRYILFSLFLLLVSFHSYGQKIVWGPEDTKFTFRGRSLNADPKTYYDGQYVYILRAGITGDFSFEKYDKNYAKVTETIVDVQKTLGSEYKIGGYTTNIFEWEVILNINSFVFVSKLIRTNKPTLLEFFEMTKEGVLTNKKLNSFEFEHKAIDLFVDHTPGLSDVNKIVLWNHAFWPSDYKKTGVFATEFLVLDNTLKELRRGTLDLPFSVAKERVEIISSAAGEDNSVHAVCNVLGPKTEYLEDSYEVFSCYSDNKLVTYKIAPPSTYLSSAQVKVLPENKLLILGSYVNGGEKGFDGFVFGIADLTKKSSPVFNKKPLEASDKELFNNPKLKPRFLNKFLLKEVKQDEQGNYDLIIQNGFNITGDVQLSYYNSIFYTKLSADGIPGSLTSIHKFQNSNFGHNFSSFIHYRKDGNLYFVFNEYETNLTASSPIMFRSLGTPTGSVPVVVTVDSKGTLISKKPFEPMKEDLFIKPISCIKVGNEYIFFAEKQERIRIGSLKIQ